MIVAFVKKKKVTNFGIQNSENCPYTHLWIVFLIRPFRQTEKNNFPSYVGKARKGTIEFGAKKFGKIIAQIEQTSSLGP